jgi:hypothetical protein
MKLNSGEFETQVKDGFFNIFIKEESDISLDGGHTFEDTTNSYSLISGEAKALIGELSDYLNANSKGE